jgi:hypothetical protein
MGGQTSPPGSFDVSLLEALETTGGVETPSNVLDEGETFTLRATFAGSGGEWNNLRAQGGMFTAHFYGHLMGPGTENPRDFGSQAGAPSPITADSMQVESQDVAIDNSGIYRCGVVLTFEANGVPWTGILGFNEDCVVQINPQEE